MTARRGRVASPVGGEGRPGGPSSRRPALRRLPALIAAVALGGCAMALAPQGLVAGAEFSVAAVDRLTAGLSREEVRASLGDPWRRSTGNRRESWEYYSRIQHRSCIALLFGVVPLERRPSDTYRARLVFGPEGLEQATLWTRDPEGRRRVDLVR